ncbi:flavin reductase family protein [Streptomyces sp. SAS_270]|uniref:flavin reductase family protein n=1 Tax=Streptomyces sp. SAS_270 TaxID=3412748 RepID=UPI00403C8A48
MTAMDAFTDLLDPDMYVVTAVADGERAGCLVGFASQCSIRPVRFVVWLSKENHTFRVARSADRLAVHLLRREQTELAALFGGETGDEVDKFARVAWKAGPEGTVVLRDAPAWFVGAVEQRVDGGDHVGFVLTPLENGGARDGKAAVFRLTDAQGIDPGHPVD